MGSIRSTKLLSLQVGSSAIHLFQYIKTENTGKVHMTLWLERLRLRVTLGSSRGKLPVRQERQKLLPFSGDGVSPNVGVSLFPIFPVGWRVESQP